jgi:hypothetical protein
MYLSVLNSFGEYVNKRQLWLLGILQLVDFEAVLMSLPPQNFVRQPCLLTTTRN